MVNLKMLLFTLYLMYPNITENSYRFYFMHFLLDVQITGICCKPFDKL